MPNLFLSSTYKKSNDQQPRTSLSIFFPTLKRKRSCNDQEEVTTTITKRKKMNTMTRIMRKIAVTMTTTTTNKSQNHNKQHILFSTKQDVLYKFQYDFSLPRIECTNGCLGIFALPEEEEEESIFNTKEGSFMEFPVPPVSPTKFHPFIDTSFSSDDDDDDEPLTPIEEDDEILYKIEHLIL